MTVRAALTTAITGWALMGGVLLALIVAATALNAAGFTANAVARSWDGTVSGVPGYEDAVTMFVGVAGLAMFPYAQLNHAHAAIDVVMQYAPPWASRAVAVLSALLIAAIALAMAYMLTLGTFEVRADRVETTVLGWPVWVFIPFAVVSCVLWALAALVSLGRSDGT
ncbi:TRAP transporter small permease subunit [Pseudooctadecabacter jejudonensis]|uniref:TRAP transporter small permease protein n=1 Tax=Pseudooctadecabacter jejudonensis TaxID=1391910 RepID=A0A1Y5RJW0_9RHOB|nr:TRAP transporter small permease subunit [Pseudooctadecabacter jejudonensis]SLN18293.1 Tripartite ATP-independent periplasmic transporters, DctQ component [Pseudooctadecabacter jejudonensis]